MVEDPAKDGDCYIYPFHEDRRDGPDFGDI